METALTKENPENLQKEGTLLQMLDKGIADMEAGRELPLEEAFDKITELRSHRRNARK